MLRWNNSYKYKEQEEEEEGRKRKDKEEEKEKGRVGRKWTRKSERTRKRSRI